MSLTTDDLRKLAVKFCPKAARWDGVIASTEWGPAHELAHVLLSTPQERGLRDYGLCGLPYCIHPTERCIVIEVAAMIISFKLHRACGDLSLIDKEANVTDGYYTIMTPDYRRRAVRMLKTRGLMRIPRTRHGLERLLVRKGVR